MFQAAQTVLDVVNLRSRSYQDGSANLFTGFDGDDNSPWSRTTLEDRMVVSAFGPGFRACF